MARSVPVSFNSRDASAFLLNLNFPPDSVVLKCLVWFHSGTECNGKSSIVLLSISKFYTGYVWFNSAFNSFSSFTPCRTSFMLLMCRLITQHKQEVLMSLYVCLHQDALGEVFFQCIGEYVWQCSTTHKESQCHCATHSDYDDFLLIAICTHVPITQSRGSWPSLSSHPNYFEV